MPSVRKPVDRKLDRRWDGPFGAFKTGQYDAEDGRPQREPTGDGVLDRLYVKAYKSSLR